MEEVVSKYFYDNKNKGKEDMNANETPMCSSFVQNDKHLAKNRADLNNSTDAISSTYSEKTLEGKKNHLDPDFLGFDKTKIECSLNKSITISAICSHKIYKVCRKKDPKQEHGNRIFNFCTSSVVKHKSEYFLKLSKSPENKKIILRQRICDKKEGIKNIYEGEILPKYETKQRKIFDSEMKNTNVLEKLDMLNIDFEAKYFCTKVQNSNFELTHWVPPKSPHNLIEEILYHDPWALLTATIFLNKTSCMLARPYIFWFLVENPDPESVIKLFPKDLEKYFYNLGLKNSRAVQIWRMTYDYLYKDWKKPTELYGIGNYGNCAYRMFCLGDFSVDPKDRYLTIYKKWYEKIGKLNTDTTNIYSYY